MSNEAPDRLYIGIGMPGWLGEPHGLYPTEYTRSDLIPQWSSDMDAAPKDGTDVLCYFPLDGLDDDWCRVVPVYWSNPEDRWNFSSRAASGFSKQYLPTHWMRITPPTETK